MARDYKVKIIRDGRNPQGFGVVAFEFEWVGGRTDQASIYIRDSFTTWAGKKLPHVNPDFSGCIMPQSIYAPTNGVTITWQASDRPIVTSGKWRRRGSNGYYQDRLVSDTQKDHILGVLTQLRPLLGNLPDMEVMDLKARYEQAQKVYDVRRTSFKQAEAELAKLMDEVTTRGILTA